MPSFNLGVVASSQIPLPVVTGGTLTSDDTYYYRTFTSNGSIDVNVHSGRFIEFDVASVGGGGGGTGYNIFRYWNGYYTGNKPCYIGSCGGGGSNIRTTGIRCLSSVNIPILIGGGGTQNSDGNPNSINANNDNIVITYGNTDKSLGSGANGLRGLPTSLVGGGNAVSSGNIATLVVRSPAFSPLSAFPFYYDGGGGAGASSPSQQVSMNGRSGTNMLSGVTVGGGGGAAQGAQQANDYDRQYFYYHYSYFPNTVSGSGGTGGGGTGGHWSLSGANGTINTGGGGGGGSSGGIGGSGIVVFRYLRSAVGG